MNILDEFEQNVQKARAGHKVGENAYYCMDEDLYAVSTALIEIIRTLEKRIENLERIAGTEEVEKE